MPRRRRNVAALALASALALACGRGAPATRSVSVALVDSVAYENDLASGWLRRVQVTSPAGVDTVDGVLAGSAPVVVGDSAVVGLLAEEDRVTGLFAYDVASRAVRRLPVPADWAAASRPKLAPDGAHVAYLAHDPRDSTGRAAGVVAAVPSMRPVLRGPLVPMLETDAGVDSVAWLDADRFELRIDMSMAVGGTLRLRGAVRPAPPRLTADTLPPSAR